MLFLSKAKREQARRNRAKADAILAEHGDAALDYVRGRVAATRWQIRDHDHWLRIEKLVRKRVR